MEHPNQAFIDWAAAQLMAQIRAGGVPYYARNTDFIWDPFLPTLRRQVQPTDKELILRLLGNPDQLMWGAILSRGILEDPEITEALLDAYEVAEHPERKLGLFQAVIARPLPPELVDRFSDWLQTDMDMFLDTQRRYFSPPQDVIARIRDRMAGPEYANKRWMYLYSVHAANDPAAVRAFLEQFCDDPDPLMARSARRSLALLER